MGDRGRGRGRRLRPTQLAGKLKRIRESLNLNQTQMPKALGLEDDVSQGMVSAFESGVREPSLIVLLAYGRLAGISTDVLIDDNLGLPSNFKIIKKPEQST